MKVLMFGWEFPPHISGGLGTACHGLTQALFNEKVKVFFVIPKVFNSSSEKEDFLIDASTIPYARTRERNESRKHVSGRKRRRQHIGETHEIAERYNMTFIEIPANLTPYSSSEQRPQSRSIAMQAWSYALRSQGTSPYTKNPDQDHNNDEASRYEETDEPFAFTGTYGHNLMNEVTRYADVALVIAGKYKFDIIHAHDWMTFPAGVAAKKKSNRPLVVHVHSTEFDRAGDRINQEVFAIEKSGFEQADRIIAVSNWTKKTLTERYAVPAEKVTVVHNGILPRSQPEEYAFPEIGSHFVTFLGRVTHQKGPCYFVEAAYKVLQEFPEAHFIVAGAGDLLPQTIERVAQLNMSSNFHFTGFLSTSQVDQIWSLTDVYVMPSVSEPFGIAPLEAIRGGVPVILSKQSGVSEVMPHAIKVDFWDVRALAAAICSVLRYDSLSRVLRQNSKKHIERLTWEKAARNVKAVYYELIGTK